MTSALTALLLLAAEPAVELAEPRPTERHHAVFAQPLATVLGAAVLHGVSVSGGVMIRANDEWSFVGDFAVLLWVKTCAARLFVRNGPGAWSPTIALNVHLFRIGYAF